MSAHLIATNSGRASRSRSLSPARDHSAADSVDASTSSTVSADHRSSDKDYQSKSVPSYVYSATVISNNDDVHLIDAELNSPVGQEHRSVFNMDVGEFSDRFADEENLRRSLRFFLMNPMEKWIARRRFPWKLSLQILKIAIVTAQLMFFAEFRMNHIRYLESSTTVFRHLFLETWETFRDINVYPPPAGAYSVFTVSDFYSRLSYALRGYYSINTSAIGSYDYNYVDGSFNIPAPDFCMSEYRKVATDPFHDTYHLDTRSTKRCLDLVLNTSHLSAHDVHLYLDKHNFTADFDKLNVASLAFALKTISLRTLAPFSNPDCFAFTVNIVFDNSGHNGQVVIDLKTTVNYISRCKGDIEHEEGRTFVGVSLALLDAVNVVTCLISFLLCVRALIRAQILKEKTIAYFRRKHNRELDLSDRLVFVNFWYIIIIINDLCIIVGTVCKVSVEYREFDSTLFSASGMLLGVGTLLVWVGLLRYLGFFSHYNVLILTMKKAFPSVIRFTSCAGLLYMGFLLCGWVVLGPYHFKFRTLMSSSECLFALINGDDMFATFNTLPDHSLWIFWFSKLYLYIFIALFIYVVLSLFISIIMDAYEVIKEKYEKMPESSTLLDFVSSCQDSPSSGIFQQSDQHFSGVMHNYFGWNRCCFGWCRKRRRENNIPYSPTN